MSDCIPPQQLREFIFQEICEHLTPKEVKHLAYTQSLPIPYLTKDGPEVLLKLETLDKFSESNLDPLAEMMRVIGRKDLAKKVEKYKKQKQQKRCKKPKDIPIAVDEQTLKQCQVTAGLQIAKVQVRMLLEQIEELQSTARDIGNSRLVEHVADAIEVIEQQLQQKLSLASTAVHMRHDSTDSSLDGRHSSLTSSEDGVIEAKQPVATLETHRRYTDMAVHSKNLSRSLPRDITGETLQSQATPPEPAEPDYEYVDMSPSPEGLRLPPAAAGSLYYHSKEIAPQSVHDERQGKLVVGRDGAAKPKRKPAVAPKPAIKKTLTSSSITQTSTTRGISTASTGGDDTSTGDSGFVDARKYRKEFSPPKVVPRHKYTPLNAEQKEAAAYYTATNTTTAQDVVYDNVSFTEDNPYVNVDY